MRNDPFQVVRDFESELCNYTGAPKCVTTTSCTSALLLALLYAAHEYGTQTVVIPKRTYVGVGMSILNAGHKIAFNDEEWTGLYRLEPFDIWDSARFISGGMWNTLPKSDSVTFCCLSFHWSKNLSISQGGAILHNGGDRVDEFLRRARFDGRKEGVHPKDDTFDMVGHHCYLSPYVAAEGLTRLALLPAVNMQLPNSDYSDLSQAPIFQRHAG
jgi:dTDP-4-amino-4,6-dideoxygalactose transaminase